MIPWDDLRFFLAVARAGNLTAAARALGVTQPTVGRRLSAFERQLGTRLFTRTPAGLVATPAALAILGHSERMEADALTVERVAAGRDAGLRGTVRVTSTEWFGRNVLAALLARFAIDQPGITVELLTDLRLYNLARREADLALRFGAFTQRDVVRRHLGRVGFALYASESYLARVGTPSFTRGCAGHALVMMTEFFPDTVWLAKAAPRARVAFRSNSRESQALVVAAGGGLATLPRYLGDRLGLRLLRTPSPVPERPIWLGVHRDTRAVPRVQALARFLGDEIIRLGPNLDP